MEPENPVLLNSWQIRGATAKFEEFLRKMEKKPPKKPKRYFLPLSLSFDDLRSREIRK